MAARVRTGLDRIASMDSEELRFVKGRRVGLVAHPASVTAELEHASDVLHRAGADLRAFFGPEHGYGGEAQDMIGVRDARDPRTGAPIRSLYGDTFASLSPEPAWLEGLDALVIDLQDVGSRYYTFVWSAVLAARACSKAGVETVILDRPNPLDGLTMEGAPQREHLRSFVGLRSVPVRHALTLGELVLDAAREEKLDGVHVLRMQGWERAMRWEDTGLSWVLPSPNMPTTDTARVYPGGCLLEGTLASEGRGLTRPFEVFGAPWCDGVALARAINAEGGEGVRARPCTFRPTFHKFGGVINGGVQVHITDAARFAPYRVYLAALRAMRKMDGFAWRTERYEFIDEHPAIDLLTGDAAVRAGIDAGASVEELLAVGADRWGPFREARGRWIYEGERAG